MRYGYPDTHVLYRDLARDYPLIVHGEGCWLVDRNGRRYLDACGGAYVACLGHGGPEAAEAVTEQIRPGAYVSGVSFTNEAAGADPPGGLRGRDELHQRGGRVAGGRARVAHAGRPRPVLLSFQRLRRDRGGAQARPPD